MTTTRTIKDAVSEMSFESEFYGVEGRSIEDLQELANDFFDAYSITIEDFIYDDVFDNVHERADGMVDIYYSDLWNSAKDYKEFTADAIEEFGGASEAIEEGGMEKLLQWGQYEYYNRFGRFCVDALQNYIEELETVEA